MPTLRACTPPILALLSLSLLGCPKTVAPPPPPADAQVSPLDAGPLERVDTDGDGLCDDTELEWGTLVTDPDSDDDGFNDGIERDLGFFPLVPDSPEREILVFLSENEASTAQLPVLRAVRGQGETYSGGFMALPLADRLGLDARAFFEGAVAVGAMPEDNVFEVRPDEERFVGVTGRTQLTFEVRFAFGDNLPRVCGRVYPFRYDVHRDDGATVFARRYLLVILPRGQRLDTVEWCAREGGCL